MLEVFYPVLSTANMPAEDQSSPHCPGESLINHSEGQLFLTEAFNIIIEEAIRKGTDVQQKVFHFLPLVWRSHPKAFFGACEHWCFISVAGL